MDQYELAVLQFLTANRRTFVAPQYLLQANNGWSACPDFVAVHFDDEKISFSIVEVSAGDKKNIKHGLAKRISDETRCKECIKILKERLPFLHIVKEEDIRFLVFIRSETFAEFEKVVVNRKDVTVMPLELTFMSWAWEDYVWDKIDFLNKNWLKNEFKNALFYPDSLKK